MSTVQAVLLGVMVAWTPSLAFMACVLWRRPDHLQGPRYQPNQSDDPQSLKHTDGPEEDNFAPPRPIDVRSFSEFDHPP